MTPEIEKRLHWALAALNVDGPLVCHETYIKVRGRWVYLRRAVDEQGQTIDFYLSQTRNTKAASRFLSKALNGFKVGERPSVIHTDRATTYGVGHRFPNTRRQTS
jgi:IS6 family transposase